MKWIVIFIVMIVLSISCSKDVERSDFLIGEWKVTSVHYLPNEPTPVVFPTSDGTIKFNLDGTGRRNFSFTYGEVSRTVVSDFTWNKISNDQLVFSFDSKSKNCWKFISFSEDYLRVSIFDGLSNEDSLLMVMFLEK